MSQICVILLQLGHNFKQLQLVSSKMPQMFDTLFKPGLTLPQKVETCYIWWGVRGEGSWSFGRLSHTLLTLLSLYPPNPSEGPLVRIFSHPFIVIVLFSYGIDLHLWSEYFLES